MNPIEQFQEEVRENIKALGADTELARMARDFMMRSAANKYTYNFAWLGRPIIQFPQDMVALQELVWTIQPDLIIETGIAHGGSLIFSASMLALLDVCDASLANTAVAPRQSRRKVLGIDVEIRAHNRAAIQAHPLFPYIEMIEASSVAPDTVRDVVNIAARYQRVLVYLDSNHTHEHVLAELEAYAPLVSQGSYCIVFDTSIDDVPKEMFPNRPWGPGNNPKTAVREFLRTHSEFQIDRSIPDKLAITVAPDGFLKRVR